MTKLIFFLKVSKEAIFKKQAHHSIVSLNNFQITLILICSKLNTDCDFVMSQKDIFYLNQFTLIFNFKSFRLYQLQIHNLIGEQLLLFLHNTPSFKLLHLNTTFLVNFSFVCL